MVHPAIIASAVTAGVGAAVAFEISVFKPWRQENWPDGIGEGIKRELRRTREDFREAAQEIRDLANGRAPRGAVHRRDGNNERRPNNRHTRGGRAQDTDSGSEDDYGSDEVGGGRNKLDRSVSVHGGDEFEMHETEVLRQRERLRKMFGDNSGNEMRNRRGVGPSKTSDLTSSNQTLPSHSQSHHFEPESPHHEIGTSSPTLSSRSADADLDDAISHLGSSDYLPDLSQHQQQLNRGPEVTDGRNSVLFDFEEGGSAEAPALPPKPEAYSNQQDSVWSLTEGNQSGNVTPKSSSSPVIQARPQPSSQNVETTPTTISNASWDQDQDHDLDLVSPPESLSNGWEQESNFSFPASNSNNVSRTASLDGREEEIVVLSPSTNGSLNNARNDHNPFEEAWVVDEEEEEEDRKARDQLSRSQSQSQSTLRQIQDNISESGDSWAELESENDSVKVDTQGLAQSSNDWSGSQSSLL